jgi:leucyl aminopeptidase (aminopeptidase T)
VTIGVRGRKPRPDDGDFRKLGRAGNIPSGEVYVSPALGTAHGIIAFDGSIVLSEGEVVIKKPILTEIKDGFITSISGGSEAAKLDESVRLGTKKALDAGKKGTIKSSVAPTYAKNAKHIGELGIGLNRKAKITANMLEDEKVYGTCHFAVGSNYDGDAEALIHLDGLVKKPDIVAVSRSGDEKAIMTDGRLVWD